MVYCRSLSRQIVCRNSFDQDKVFDEVLGTCIRCRDVVVGLILTIDSLGKMRLRISIHLYATTTVGHMHLEAMMNPNLEATKDLCLF
jgi:hypothetical protein